MKADLGVQCQLDHLVVCAQSCEAGVRWFERLSGIVMPAGGKHPLMATHNHLSALSENSFLEIIANDPQAEPPARPRWFQLDDAAHEQRLDKGPLLSTWVVRTNNLNKALQIAANAGIDAGVAVELSRGDLTWQLALKSDGTLACQGLFPILIQWPDGVNPVQQMHDQGVRLEQLTLACPEAALLRHALQAIGADDLATVTCGEARMQADMRAGARQFQISN